MSCGETYLPVGRLVDAADSKPACRQAGLPFARMCWFDSSPGHRILQLFVGFFFLLLVTLIINVLWRNLPAGRQVGRRSRLKTCLPSGRSAVRKNVLVRFQSRAQNPTIICGIFLFAPCYSYN